MTEKYRKHNPLSLPMSLTVSVIFIPAQNQTVQSALAQADSVGEGPSSHGVNNPMGVQSSAAQEYGGNSHGFQSAINSHVIENM